MPRGPSRSISAFNCVGVGSGANLPSTSRSPAWSESQVVHSSRVHQYGMYAVADAAHNLLDRMDAEIEPIVQDRLRRSDRIRGGDLAVFEARVLQCMLDQRGDIGVEFFKRGAEASAQPPADVNAHINGIGVLRQERVRKRRSAGLAPEDAGDRKITGTRRNGSADAAIIERRRNAGRRHAGLLPLGARLDRLDEIVPQDLVRLEW